jgi:23S rRNA (adenine2503-C2)-methyltransferase
VKIVQVFGTEGIARVFIAQNDQGHYLEFVESVQPPIPRKDKWVNIVSTLYGCPIQCRFCDAGGGYHGRASFEDMRFQIDTMIHACFGSSENPRTIPVKKWKVQFARMGEPALNPEVLEVLESLPGFYDAPGLMPCISTIAPRGSEPYFERLLQIKKKWYSGRFQLQFSIHTTDETQRRWLIPVPIWSFEEIAQYGNAFFRPGDRKITLNFAWAKGMTLNPEILLRYFSPRLFLIKITPVNPTYRSEENKISSQFHSEEDHPVIECLRQSGYDTILSIGELEENQIGSNCGQYVQTHKQAREKINRGYQLVP